MFTSCINELSLLVSNFENLLAFFQQVESIMLWPMLWILVVNLSHCF